MKLNALVIMLLVFNLNSVFAAPINELEQGQSALGMTVQGGDKNQSYFWESKFGPNATIGFQVTDWSNSSSMTDIYAQFEMNPEADNPLRLIVGTKTYDSSSRVYLGAAMSSPLSMETKGYASAVFGSGIQDLQFGANYSLSDSALLNLNYRILRYEGSKNGIGLGVTCKF